MIPVQFSYISCIAIIQFNPVYAILINSSFIKFKLVQFIILLNLIENNSIYLNFCLVFSISFKKFIYKAQLTTIIHTSIPSDHPVRWLKKREKIRQQRVIDLSLDSNFHFHFVFQYTAISHLQHAWSDSGEEIC